MALATLTDVQNRLGASSLTSAQEDQVEYLLDAATSSILLAIGKDQEWVDDQDELPSILETVCVEIVVRVYTNPEAADSKRETIGSYSYSTDFRNQAVNRAGRPLPAIAPTPDERAMLREAVGQPTTAAPRIPSVLEDVFPNQVPVEWWDE